MMMAMLFAGISASTTTAALTWLAISHHIWARPVAAESGHSPLNPNLVGVW